MSLELTACQTKHREYQYHHNIEVNEENLKELDVNEGDRVIAENHHDHPYPACQGRIHLNNEFDDGEVGLGYTLRYAVGVPEAEKVTIKTLPEELEQSGFVSQFSDRIFGVRPVICRVRMAVEPDPGFRVCRITNEAKELLGISYGDRLVLESAQGKARDVKALPQAGKPEKIKEEQKEQNPDRYPSCFDEIDIEGVRGTKIDVPEIFIDRDLRSEVSMVDESIPPAKRGPTDEGVCQPIVVYRDTIGLFGRVFLEIATPLVIGAVVAAVGFETQLLQEAFGLNIWTVLSAKTALLVVALMIAISAVWYRTRVVLLD